MTLSDELRGLDRSFEVLSPAVKRVFGEAGSPMYVLDFIATGAIKRSLSLASGLSAMIGAKNMVCSRALLRMHLDTVSRFLAYTYVDDPETVARAVTSGSHLKAFKCSDGKKLTDAYLVERMSLEYPWVRHVYEFTSGYVHFSERQFFDSIQTLGDDEDCTIELHISHVDARFPDPSWIEVVSCFNQVTQILAAAIFSYATHKFG